MNKSNRLRILHTADWHLGKSLFDRDRYDEFEAFLDWLLQAIIEHSVDAVLIAGDIFDTTAPTNRAQTLYFRKRIADTSWSLPETTTRQAF
jgi:exonuclease SbcD